MGILKLPSIGIDSNIKENTKDRFLKMSNFSKSDISSGSESEEQPVQMSQCYEENRPPMSNIIVSVDEISAR